MMRWGFADKLALLLTAMVLLAAGLTGYYVFDISQKLLISSAKDKLLTATQVVGRRIATTREESSKDLLLLAQHPSTLSLLERPNTPTELQVTTLFRLLMQGNPSYTQIRLIAAEPFGPELLRLERTGDVLHQAPQDDLEEKGHYPFVRDTLRLPAGSTYISRMAIHHDKGVYSDQKKPSVQLSMPVVNAQGQAMGLVAINLDLEATFALLASDLPKSFQLYLCNGEGDILVHPSPERTFGFDNGRRRLIQDEFNDLGPLVKGGTTQVLLEKTADSQHPQALAGAFTKVAVRVASVDTHLILGLAQPLSEVLSEAQALRDRTINLTLLLAVSTAVLVTLVIARGLTRPLASIHRATQTFDAPLLDAGMPLDRTDEMGDLARSILNMKSQIRDQIQTLQDNQEEFEYLAHHDPLTGLPNRRMLEDRLGQAIARAQRHQTLIALLFVDLDKFKEVNDRYGHDAGDAVLIEIAKRLNGLVREVDTVARLGGDEFIVMLDAPNCPQDIGEIASRILETLKQPITVNQQTLHIDASVGISLYPQDGQTGSALLSLADTAMYRVKMAGRAGFGFAEDVPQPGTATQSP